MSLTEKYIRGLVRAAENCKVNKTRAAAPTFDVAVESAKPRGPVDAEFQRGTPCADV
jgi:hypothetical protein